MSRRNPTKRTVFSLFLGLTCVACGLEQEVSFDDPEASPPEGPSVTVLWNGIEADVFLNDLDKVPFKGTQCCLLWDILLSAGLEDQDIRSLRFDFEGADGFRPSSVGCDPLDGETLELGYVDPETLELRWDDTLALRGCYWVTQTASILGEPALDG